MPCHRCGRLARVKDDTPPEPGFVECPEECGSTQYCSPECLEMDRVDHSRVCLGRCATTDHPLYQLKVLALQDEQYYPTIQLAVFLVLSGRNWRSVCRKEEEEEEEPLRRESWTEFVEPAHKLLLEVLREPQQQDSADSESTSTIDPPSLEEWIQLLQCVNRTYITGSTRSSYAVLCDVMTARDGWDPSNPMVIKLLEGSTATSLIELMDEPDQCFPPVPWFVLAVPPAERVDGGATTTTTTTRHQHSCIPSYETVMNLTAQGSETSISTPNPSTNRRLPILTYRSLTESPKNTTTTQTPPDDPSITVSLIDNTYPWEERRELLQERGIRCQCLRCRFEQQPTAESWSPGELRRLLALAKTQERYDDAMDIVTVMVQQLQATNDKRSQNLGEALWEQARIAGWQGDFSRREELLISAVLDSTYEPLQTALLEANAYYRNEGETVKHPGAPWKAAKELEDDVFIGEHVLDAQECQDMVAAAEAHFQNKKDYWTTSRHFAVPTTDVPIYQIPELLQWFNVQLEQTIFPAMLAHFEIPEGQRLRIFDAFLVKYDAAAGQKRLPLHNDQSEYSLTIAMNPLYAYEGGGTYFCDSDSSIKTDVGGVTSFRGELLHAGTTITRGLRYIIVCFIYAKETLQ